MTSASGGDQKRATLLMVEKIENMVGYNKTEAIRNLKIDKITVWDSGNNSEVRQLRVTL